MKKFFALVLIVFLAGCGSANKEINTVSTQSSQPKKQVEHTSTVPEPYSKAIEKINEGDLDLALTYLDLTIKDTNDPKYTYNSHLFKSLILRSKMMALSELMDKMGTGAQKGRSLYSKQDLEQLKKLMNPLEKEYRNLLPDYDVSLEYIYTNFSSTKSSEVFDLILVKPVTTSNDLSFFADVGYPVPKDVEMDEFKEKTPYEYFFALGNELFPNKKIDYPKYFYLMAGGFIDNDVDLQKRLVNKIVEITEDDKYNEYRIKATEFLNKK